MLPVVTIDFETLPIGSRPDYPPRPVGVSLLGATDVIGDRSVGQEADGYWRWGHPVGNNCDEEFAMNLVSLVFAAAHRGECTLLFFNMKFDLSVACEGWGLLMPRWHECHDAMYLAFLHDPHAKNLDLKSLATNILNTPPDERDAINDWVIANIKELRKQYAPEKIATQKGKVANLWRWYSRAPGDIVEGYANGDTWRTRGLFDVLYPLILENGMGPAYDRLREITPIFMENERLGMRVDVERLRVDVQVYSAAFARVESALRDYLGVPDLNLDADEDVSAALVAIDAVDPSDWVMTKSGQLSMSKDNLKPRMFKDPQLASALGYRNRLATCLKMFMEPWLEQALKTGGTIHTNWNITRGIGGGTRTGRPSTNDHNFLNLSKDFEGRTDGYVHPAFLDLPPLPLVRDYVLADEGHVFLHRDFSGQELRVFAHFEAGPLNAAYNENPKLDPHAMVGGEMSRLMGLEFERTKVKVLNFQSLYGGGVPAIMAKLDCDQADAKRFKSFHDQALPGRGALAEVLEEITEAGDPIATWGGRLYFVEEPAYSERFKRWMTWFYKLINYIVQGSAADLTIVSILDWWNDPERDPRCRLLVTVYDEINISCPPEIEAQQMLVLKRAMEKQRLSVPMLSDGKRGERWGKLEKCA